MIVAVIQARMSSARLPGKVLREIAGRPMLARQLERVLRATSLEAVVVATSRDPTDDAVAHLAAQCGVPCHRGPLHDVLRRVHDAAKAARASHVVRLTGDCPLSDPGVIDDVVGAHLASGADYTSNTLERTYPDGLDVEVVTLAALAAADAEASSEFDREHVTPFVYARPERFRLRSVTHSPDLGQLRWVVDHPADLEVVAGVFERLLPRDPRFGMADVLRLCDAEPGLFDRNRGGGPR